MTKDLVFMTLMQGIVYIAPFPRDALVKPFGTSPPKPYSSTLQMTYFGLDPAKAGLTYGSAAQSLSEVAELFWKANKYPEIHFNVALVGEPIGQGSITKGRI